MPLSDWFAQPAPSLEAESLVSKFERDPEWVNCTTKLLSGAGMDVDSLDGSVIFDTLGARTNSIRLYQLYAKRDGTAVAGIASLGSGLDGHPGIVHGGVTALLFDNTFGWANAIGLLKEQTRAMIMGADLENKRELWPCALKHAAFLQRARELGRPASFPPWG